MRKDFTVFTKKEDGSEEKRNYYVESPVYSSIKLADRYRAKTWHQCLDEGVLTQKELTKALITRELWDESKEQEETRIGKEIQKLEKKLFLGDGSGKKAKLADGKAIALEMRELRVKLRNHIAEKVAMEENTAEALADNARFDFLVSECTFNENGTRVYKDIEEYNSKSSDQVSFLAAANLAQLIYQYDTKFEETLPENVWLKKFDIVNDKLEFVNDSGDLVDEDGRKINAVGHYVNEEGKRVDRDGNPLNDDGSYVLQVEYETEPKEPKEPKKKAK